MTTSSTKPPSAPPPTNHHDQFFKEFYSHPPFARELFQLVFAKDELAAFDWTKLKAEKDTFTDKRADLVFSVPLKNTPTPRVTLCLLLEHKSHYRRHLFLQLLHYQTRILEKTFQTTGRALPVIPILFYHGKTPWKWPRSFQEGVWGKSVSDIPAFCRQGLLNYDLRVLDAQTLPASLFKDKTLQSRGALYLLKEVWYLQPEASSIENVLRLIGAFSETRDDLILSAMEYLVQAVPGLTRQVWETAERVAVQKGLLAKGGYMNIKERFKEEGRLEGIQKGIQKGRLEGIQKGRLEVVRNMLDNKMDASLIAKVTGLPKKEIQKLKNGA